MRLIGLAVVVAVSVVLAPLAAEAQQAGKIPRLGYLVLPPLSETPSPERAAFLAGLRELGWIDGKTIAIEYRSAKWNVELLDDLAEELVRMKVDIIVTAAVPSLEERQALAPTGKLRVCLYLGGPTNAIKDPVSGEIKGVGFDLGQALAQRMKVPYEPVIYPTPRAVVEAITSGGCDVTFIAQDPDREKIMDFTPVYMSIEHGFLVPSSSPISTMAEVDRPGIRVGVPAGGSVIPPLRRTLRNAELVGSSIAGAVELLRSGQVDVFAANKANLFEISDKLPGSRVLEGRFSVDRFALGIPKGREPGLAYVRKFIEDAKSEGRVDAAIKRAGVRGTIKE